VKINFNRQDAKETWLKKPISAGDFQRWLTDRGSLTLRLQQRHLNFLVQPVDMRYAKPFTDEKKLLGSKNAQKALIRKVVLVSNHQPVVFAHSVLPRSSLRGAWHGLSHLGARPLGAALFANPKVKRTPLVFKKLSCRHPLYLEAIKYMIDPPSFLWARRSIFSLKYAKILVTEVFLPNIKS
jgi:chorismate lyase